MKTSQFKHLLRLAAAVALSACAMTGAAQTKPAASPAATAATTSADQKPVRQTARKRRAASGPATMGCEAVNDPWENICTIRKHAETACSDLPAPAAKKAARARKGAPPPVAERNPRQECVDAYMRNV